MIKNTILYTILSISVGVLYYLNMSLSIPKESNCSFMANIWTDIGAFLVGCILLYKGLYIHNDMVVYICGLAIITEHVLQLVFNKI